MVFVTIYDVLVENNTEFG